MRALVALLPFTAAAVLTAAGCEARRRSATGAAAGASAGTMAVPASAAASASAAAFGSASAPQSAAPSARPALASPEPLVGLAVAGHHDAVVSLPLGATTRRPVVIAAHGNYDTPESQCGVWRALVHDRAFVLCPRGIARTDSPSDDDTRWTYADSAAFTKELDASLEALRARYAEYVDAGPMVYTGFSLGAILGVPYLMRDPARFPRVVLVEGGHDAWTAERARAFGAKGGQRVLFACGQPGCVIDARGPSSRLLRANVSSKTVHGAGVGHGYFGAVASEVGKQIDWLLEGDPRWTEITP